ncbi:hypothetical protein BATDEDRAFT_28893 [Batrachochytrium dendrobatidis JAM81]|uniref:Uncharacterized protein n=1 Tax=Batrachochytrium dendrobatidis (strain JAM81 / FGSC 10211) TaxID=684364 RepID=F4PFJ2_BATDJ|nr:uncharacterized protein BATDEDRAFT_28893 [Batrachochytrium dendrobatidis JAM81]EGF76003.1 hypothetical protein BATDEDRAFT_28893 [Batrachochytrium dendrobatidis JAM81]|eukprot:XP_006683375.1 hypothetical protein BATDEDRAFT_28893 [Batrachochytrium dendrobatidis JAM81]
MKPSITLLSSILAVCSVTTASPVDPSSTMSAEASTLTASPSATASTESSILTFTDVNLDLELVDCGTLSKKSKKLIKNYATTKRGVKTTREMCKSISESISVEKKLKKQLVKRVDSLKDGDLAGDNGLTYAETVAKLQETRKNLLDLKQQERKCDKEFSDWRKNMRLAEKGLEKYFIWDSEISCLISLYTIVHYQNPTMFLLVKLHDSLQQSSDDQPTYEETSIAHHTQTPSSTPSKLQKVCSRIKSSIGSRWSQHTDDDREPLV